MTKLSPLRPTGAPFLFLLSALLLGGCKKQEIRSYEVPKDLPTTKAASSATPAPSADVPDLPKGHIEWTTLPLGWDEKPVTSAMRIANFTIKGAEGREAELIVIPLPELAGKETEFVNMWREQIQLPHADPDSISKMKEEVNIAGVPGQLYDMVSDAPSAGSQFKQRVLVAMSTQAGTTWFFKLTGADQLVAAEKPNLIKFLEGVTLHPAPAAFDPHAGLALPSSSGSLPIPAAPAPAGSAPEWSVPDGWKSTAPGSMAIAKFDLPGGEAQVSVLALGGDGGGLLMNINRWRGQLQLDPVSETDLGTITSTVDAGAEKATIVDIAAGNRRLVAAIVPHGQQTWFYKSMGDSKTVAREKDAFLQFVKSAQY